MKFWEKEITWVIAIAFSIAAGITAGKALEATTLDNATMFLLGICFNTLFVATIGALVAIFSGAEPIKPASRMWMLFIASSLVGAVSVVALPKIPALSWVGDIPPTAVALIMGFSMRWVIPLAIDSSKGWAQKKFGTPDTDAGGQ